MKKTNTRKRNEGYYYVRLEGSKIYDIAYWWVSNQVWLMVGDNKHFEDKDFVEIDERRIERK